jgi:hypothetical protein
MHLKSYLIEITEIKVNHITSADVHAMGGILPQWWRHKLLDKQEYVIYKKNQTSMLFKYRACKKNIDCRCPLTNASLFYVVHRSGRKLRGSAIAPIGPMTWTSVDIYMQYFLYRSSIIDI